MEFAVFNSVLGMQFRTCKNFQASTDFSLVESPKIFTNTKATPQSLPLRFCESQNLVKKELCEAPENSPASWCKKSDSKGAVVPPADFLLEADKRGSPPKSEKAAAFWEHNKKELGGTGRGVQPFLREKTSEISGERIAESIRDFSPTAQNDKIMDCNADSANLLAMTNFYFLKNRRILRNKA